MHKESPVTDRAWNRLLDLVERRQVVPIVGHDLVTVQTSDGERTLESVLASRVAESLGLSEPAPPATLNDVAYRLIAIKGRDALPSVYEEVYEQLRIMPLEPPPALQSLASLRPLRLFVTTTFDPLLALAVQSRSPAGSAPVSIHSFDVSGGERRDLAAPLSELAAPVVYHLFGKASSMPDYAITEEDTLEFVHALQSPTRQPPLLFDELRRRSVLLLGSGFPDWLVRFVLRVARPDRFMHVRFQPDVIAESRTRDRDSLAEFLRHFSTRTLLHPLGATEFVNELAERWAARAATAPSDSPPSEDEVEAPHAPVTPAALPDDAVFISYASEARDSARQVANALKRVGLPVWFDERDLQPGDAYAQKLLARIQRCALFVPVLSRHVLASADPAARGRWFRREWKEATDRLPEFFGLERTFIVPCRVDDIDPQSDGIPAAFQALHASRASTDAELEAFAMMLREKFKHIRLRQAAV